MSAAPSHASRLPWEYVAMAADAGVTPDKISAIAACSPRQGAADRESRSP